MKNPLVQPAERLRRCGFPFHGFVTGGVLTPFNGGPAIGGLSSINGQSIAVRNPVQPVDDRSAEEIAADAAAFRDWQPYAIAQGYAREIYGAELGEDAWLYCDSAGQPWVVEFTQAPVGVGPYYSAMSIDVILRRPFGWLGRTAAPIDALLASYELDATDMDGGGDTLIAPYTGFRAIYNSPSEDGARCLLNVTAGAFSLVINDIPQQIALIEVALSGAGSTEDIDLGAGITATITPVKVGAACAKSENITWINPRPPASCGAIPPAEQITGHFDFGVECTSIAPGASVAVSDDFQTRGTRVWAFEVLRAITPTGDAPLSIEFTQDHLVDWHFEAVMTRGSSGSMLCTYGDEYQSKGSTETWTAVYSWGGGAVTVETSDYNFGDAPNLNLEACDSYPHAFGVWPLGVPTLQPPYSMRCIDYTGNRRYLSAWGDPLSVAVAEAFYRHYHPVRHEWSAADGNWL